MKVGVLYPRSSVHPGITADFIDGLKAALKHSQLTNGVQLVMENIDFGGKDKEVYEKAEKLLILESVDILVAYIDLRVIPLLEPLLDTTGKLMIVVNPGANYPYNWIPRPGIIYLTLQHSFLCWLTGLLAAKSKTPEAAMATCFYDAGYLHIAAITNSYMKGGGNNVFNYVNNDRDDAVFAIKPLIDFLSSNKKIDNLLCVFDTKPASLFFDRLAQLEDNERLHLFASPMMLEQKAYEAKGFNFTIEGYIPYHRGAENQANVEFRKLFATETKREASFFAMQGWEAGLILQAIFNDRKDSYTDGKSIAGFLESIAIESPRGNLKMDKETHYFIAPVYKSCIKNTTNEILSIPVKDIEDEWERFTANPVLGPSSGWTNTYLCY